MSKANRIKLNKLRSEIPPEWEAGEKVIDYLLPVALIISFVLILFN
jgi:hypothetical protein